MHNSSKKLQEIFFGNRFISLDIFVNFFVNILSCLNWYLVYSIHL